MKKKKLLPLPKLRDKAWETLSKYVRRMAADEREIVKCFTCGSQHIWKDIQVGHFFHGHMKKTFLMTENVRPQCVACNKWKSGNLAVYAAELIRAYGAEHISRLYTAYLEDWKPTREYYDKIIERYK